MNMGCMDQIVLIALDYLGFYIMRFVILIYDNGFGLSTTTKIMTSSYGNLRIFVENDYNKDLNLIKSGDILFFHRQSYKDSLTKEDNRYPGHCGIYLSDNYFIQSSSVIGKIIISNFELNDYWKKVFGRK